MGYGAEEVQGHLDFIKAVFDAIYDEFPSDCEVHWLSRTPEGQLKFHVFVSKIKKHVICRPDNPEALSDPVAFAKTIREQLEQFLASTDAVIMDEQQEE